jgi:hypothetical protein
MRFFRTILLAVVSVLSVLYLIGFVRAVLPLRDSWQDDGFRIFCYPQITAYTPFDLQRHAWGPRSWSLFQVADFPTGEVRVVFSLPSWYLALPSAGILIYAVFFICHKRRAA